MGRRGKERRAREAGARKRAERGARAARGELEAALAAHALGPGAAAAGLELERAPKRRRGQGGGRRGEGGAPPRKGRFPPPPGGARGGEASGPGPGPGSDSDSGSGSDSGSDSEPAGAAPPRRRARTAAAAPPRPAGEDESPAALRFRGGFAQPPPRPDPFAGLPEDERRDRLRYAAAVERDRLGLVREGEGAAAGLAEGGAARGALQQGGAGDAPPAGGRRSCAIIPRRPEALREARLSLPVVGMEQELMEQLEAEHVLVVCGETGSGKTTQLPQFLYEAGYGTCQCARHRGLIGVTEPRRIAATSTAERVAAELGEPLGEEGVVGFQVRHDQRLGPRTAIKFLTDGVLLRELQEDFLLLKYSALVLDEAHERGLNTDVLLGLLARAVPYRARLAAEGGGVPPLKLVIMSATLQADGIVGNPRLFRTPPPVLRVPARQFPVTVHFSRRTEQADYLGATLRKVRAIHRQLPAGGVLVFLTGQKEVELVCRKLEEEFGAGRAGAGAGRRRALRGDPAGDGDPGGGEGSDSSLAGGDAAEAAEAPEGGTVGQGLSLFGNPDDFDSGEELSDWEGEEEGEDKPPAAALGMRCVPMYSKLPAAEQRRAFEPVEENVRLVVVATNIAETSITIPGIRYVVDSGREKQKLRESVASGVARFSVGWISKASAAQRTGRAGRTGPGHCYRLYSSAFYNDSFEAHAEPEVMRSPLEGVALQLKVLGVDKPHLFPFPSAPPEVALRAAERCLARLGAVDGESGLVSPLGRALSVFPISPRHARLLVAAGTAKGLDRKVLGRAFQVAVAAAAALSLEPPFKDLSRDRARREARETLLGKVARGSDVFPVVAALRGFEQAHAAGEGDAFCEAAGLHVRGMREMMLLRRQLAAICGRCIVAGRGIPEEDGLRARLREAVAAAGGARTLERDPPPEPGKKSAMVVRYAICQGWADRVMRRCSAAAASQRQARGATAIAARYVALLPPEEPAHLPGDSRLAAAPPELVVYHELLANDRRTYVQGGTAVERQWVPARVRREAAGA